MPTLSRHNSDNSQYRAVIPRTQKDERDAAGVTLLPPPGFPQGTIILRDFWVSGPSQEQINQLSENTIRAQLECLKNKRW
jgi:hypothetical protein